MLTENLHLIANILRDWASQQSELRRVWIYGSQAKEYSSLESDLDVAVEVIPKDGENSYTVFVCCADDWRSELSPRIAPYKLDLKLYDTSGTKDKVRSGVDKHGILVYKRTA